MTQSACPSTEDLIRLLRGELPESQFGTAEGHFATCLECGRRAEALDQEVLRVRPVRGDWPRVEQVDGLIRRLVDLPVSWDEGITAPFNLGGDRQEADPAALPQVPGYEVLEELGRGGMGVVYKARQRKADRLVALKMIRAGGQATADQRARFRIEVQAAARLAHPHIVQVYDVGEHDGCPFFSQEFCAGGSLDRRLNGTPLLPREAARLVEQLAGAVQAAHDKGVLHRDLKPANVLLAEDGTPKVSDFGLARKLDDDSGQTHSGTILGTPSWMAPEQAAGQMKDVGPLADVYALGAILYECLTGRPPFKGATLTDTLLMVRLDEPVPPSRLHRAVPRDLETICLKCLRKGPHQRYATAGDLADDLHRFLDGRPIRARRTPAWEHTWKWARRRPTLASLLAVILLGVVGIVVEAIDAEAQKQVAQQERTRSDDLAVQYRQEKDNAERLEHKAQAEAARAVAGETLARRELARSERLLYLGHLLQSNLLWEAGHAAAARRRLDACRLDQRGWEHALLRQRCDETCVTLTGHTLDVRSVAFSPDGNRLVSADADDTLRVWDATTGLQLLTWRSEDLGCACFSPDGREIASSWEFGVEVRDARTGQIRLSLPCHGMVSAVAYSPDGRTLAAAGSTRRWYGRPGPGFVTLWDTRSGRQSAFLEDDREGILCLAFSPDGRTLATGAERTLELWDVATGKERATLVGHTDRITGVAFSPDGLTLASISYDLTIGLWDVPHGFAPDGCQGGPRHPLFAGGGRKRATLQHSGGFSSVAFSPDGLTLASAGGDKLIRLWDARTGRVRATLEGHEETISTIAFSPDGKRLVSGGSDRTVKIWDVQGNAAFTLVGHTSGVYSLQFSPDGKHLASGGKDGAVRLWDPGTGRQLACRPFHRGKVYAVAFSPDGRLLATGGADQTAKVQDAATGQVSFTLHGHTNNVDSLVFSPDGLRLVSASDDGTIKVWDTRDGRQRHTFRVHTDAVNNATFSPDGRLLASASDDRSVKVWDPATGGVIHTLRGHTGAVYFVTFSPDGTLLATASQDATVKLWDAATGRELGTYRGHTANVRYVAFHPGGHLLASASEDRTVKLWDVGTGEEVLTLTAHTDAVLSVCFSPDGNRLASASRDGTVRLWEAARGREVLTLEGHVSRVTGVGFSPDGARVVARGADGTVQSWQLGSGQRIVPCVDPPPAADRMALSADGVWRAEADGMLVRLTPTADSRPPSGLVFLARLMDVPTRRAWHRAEAAAAEEKGEWFAAAHHLKQLHCLADPEDDLPALRVHRLRALTVLAAHPEIARQLRSKIAEKWPVVPQEQALADAYDLLEGDPAIRTPVLHFIRAAEQERLLHRTPPNGLP